MACAKLTDLSKVHVAADLSNIVIITVNSSNIDFAFVKLALSVTNYAYSSYLTPLRSFFLLQNKTGGTVYFALCNQLNTFPEKR